MPNELPHQTEATLSARIDDLQVKVAFLDDLVESLNDLVARQNQSIADLQTQMKILYQRMESVQHGEHGVQPFDPAKEVPPHY